MATTTELPRPYGFLLSEAPGTLSRETVTIVSGTGVVAPGTVLGKITASGKYEYFDASGNTGIETAVAITLERADATSADAACAVIFRLAEVTADALVWSGTNDATDKANGLADLATKYIIAR